jgi:hypothetical protein
MVQAVHPCTMVRNDGQHLPTTVELGYEFVLLLQNGVTTTWGEGPSDETYILDWEQQTVP